MGIRTSGILPITRMGITPDIFGVGPDIPTVNFNPALAIFTPRMAKRSRSVFATAPIVQGKWDGSGVPDVLSFGRGSQISNHFYANFDAYQFAAVKWWTPEKARTAGQTNDEYLWYINSSYWCRYEHDNSNLVASVGGQTHSDSLTTVAGTLYCVCVSGDVNNTIDGTNYMRISVNDTHDYGASSQPTAIAPDATCYLGSDGDEYPASAILEGVTFYRRVLYDGTYGVDVGNGDEINLIYAAGAGKDPCLITGSWDAVFCLPTNATAEELVTGIGEAWSHPHSSNVVTDGFCQTAYESSAWEDEGSPIVPYSVEFDGLVTDINCGSGATLDNLPSGDMTWECWFNWDGGTDTQYLTAKYGPSGWYIRLINGLNFSNYLGFDTTSINWQVTHGLEVGKWTHVRMTYDTSDSKARIWKNGVLLGTSPASAGAYSGDASGTLYIGSNEVGSISLNGKIAYVGLANAVNNSDTFVPPSRLNPGVMANRVEQWNFRDGAGATLTAEVTTPGNDGVISDGVWNIVADMATDAPGQRIYNWGYLLGGITNDIRDEDNFGLFDENGNSILEE